MLYSGFDILPRSVVRWQTGFAARITRTLSDSGTKMKKILTKRNVIVAILCLIAFLSLQIVLYLHASSARTRTLEYMGRGLFAESQMAIEYDYYGEGEDRWTTQIPEFTETFRMHTVSFEWNQNKHIPPVRGMDRADVWVGTATLTPKAPWRYIDPFGVLGPFRYSVYGDWQVRPSP